MYFFFVIYININQIRSNDYINSSNPFNIYGIVFSQLYDVYNLFTI